MLFILLSRSRGRYGLLNSSTRFILWNNVRKGMDHGVMVGNFLVLEIA